MENRKQLMDSERRLQMYISLRTAAVPEDIALYRKGQVNQYRCLFCRNPNASHPVISDNADTGTNMCDFCHATVEDNLGNLNNTRIGPPKEIFKIAERKKMLIDSLSIHHDYRLPEDIKKYYTHLNGSNKDYFCGHADRCYICDRLPQTGSLWGEAEEFDEIIIPVRSDKHLSGGRVHICPDKTCQDIRTDYNWVLEELTHYDAYSKQIELVDKQCPTCRNTYFILGAANEIEYRTHAPDIYEWQCPRCAYEMLNKWEKDPILQIFYPEVVGDPRYDLIQRAITRVCNYCRSATSIDLYLTEFSVMLGHMVDNKICCRECGLQRTWLQQDSVYRVLDSSIYIEVHSTDLTYSVFRMKKGKLEPIFINCTSNAESPMDTLFIAFEEIAKLLIGNTELWE